MVSVLITFFIFVAHIRSEDNLQESVISLCHLGPGIELMLSGLAASALTRRAVPSALGFLRQVSHSRLTSKVTLGKDDLELILLPLLPGPEITGLGDCAWSPLASGCYQCVYFYMQFFFFIFNMGICGRYQLQSCLLTQS